MNQMRADCASASTLQLQIEFEIASALAYVSGDVGCVTRPHRNADVRLLECWRIVYSVSCDCHKVASPLHSLHDVQLLLRCSSGEDDFRLLTHQCPLVVGEISKVRASENQRLFQTRATAFSKLTCQCSFVQLPSLESADRDKPTSAWVQVGVTTTCSTSTRCRQWASESWPHLNAIIPQDIDGADVNATSFCDVLCRGERQQVHLACDCLSGEWMITRHHVHPHTSATEL